MILYHGTSDDRLVSIFDQGLLTHSQVLNQNKGVRWGASEDDGVHFETRRDRARCETTQIGTPVDRAVVLEVSLSKSEVEPYYGPHNEYTRNSGKKSTTAYVHRGRVCPTCFVAANFYEEYGQDPKRIVLNQTKKQKCLQ